MLTTLCGHAANQASTESKFLMCRVRVFIISVFIILIIFPHHIVGESKNIPKNAHAIYGGGWECDCGYRRCGNECRLVEVPEHGHLDYSGHSWECDFGYYRVGNECRTVIIPEHAHLDYSSHNWECDRGYYRHFNECRPIDVPQHASLNLYGDGWSCDDGYIKRGEECVHVTQASDNEIRDHMIKLSISSYSGNCPCPYNVDRRGYRCGGRSAYSRAGGYSPLCYRQDISDEDVAAFRLRYSRRIGSYYNK